ncbi:MAG: aminopeptidase P family protein [Flavobacteriaceae bacterium]|nr:aminopeptidase P family protein [Flavobacteriaceae bacterium]
MRYKPLPSGLYSNNRKEFMGQMEFNSIAIFNSNDQYPVGADTVIPFQQHRDLFYLTGIDQEKTILLLYPKAIEKKHREILFITKTNPQIALWEGNKLSKNQAQVISGIKTIYWLEDFEKILQTLAAQSDTFYFNTNEHYRQKVETQTREDRFIDYCKKKFPAHRVAKSNPILQVLRSIKKPEEIKQIHTACQITKKGFLRVLPFVKPGVWEFEIEAEYMHEFICNRSRGFAYSPIIASGKNALVLHYIENNQQCQKDQLLLMDVGAEYGNYASDMTRTIPISGVFSKRQKKIYQSVLRIKNEATKMLMPGTIWKQYHIEVGKLMTSELLELGLIDRADIENQSQENPAYKKHFMHGTSHHMGLDTHDYGLLHQPMKKNMVFTVEPGIYIPEESIGIRLEDDVVIQEHANPKNLMSDIPIEIEEIEELMNQKH